jgi:hypothetical protein
MIHRSSRRLGLLAGASIAIQASAAAAQSPSPLPAGDPGFIISIQIENDVIARTDRDYTSGIRIGWTSPSVDATGNEYLPRFLTELGNTLWGPGRQRLAIDFSNALYTPKDTAARTPDPRDRPYAGVTLGSMFLLHDTTTTRDVLGFSLGVLGPSARGENIQNGFHDLIGDQESAGWSHQIKDMPIVQVVMGRTWRHELTFAPGRGIDVDILPSAIVGVGTLRDYAQVGFQLRVGQGLQSDFGTSRISPGLSGSDAYTPNRDFVWYLFAGADGQAIGWDATLDGNPFHSGPRVTRQPFVAEMEGGLAVIYHGVRITYTHIAQTQSFYRQRGGLFQFGSLAISTRF